MPGKLAKSEKNGLTCIGFKSPDASAYIEFKIGEETDKEGLLADIKEYPPVRASRKSESFTPRGSGTSCTCSPLGCLRTSIDAPQRTSSRIGAFTDMPNSCARGITVTVCHTHLGPFSEPIPPLRFLLSATFFGFGFVRLLVRST